jgi:hypothetical protein
MSDEKVKSAEEPALHVFHDGEDWYIAASVEDCAAVYEEHVGEPPDADFQEFKQLPDDSKIRIVCDENGTPDDEGEAIERTCAEWAASQGRSFLCSRNY